MSRDPVLKNIARYFSSSVYQSIFGVINAFIKAKFLTPELLGLWSLLSIIPDYSSYSDLGSRTAMQYLIPYHEGKGESQKNDEIKGTVFCPDSKPIMIIRPFNHFPILSYLVAPEHKLYLCCINL